MRDEAQETNKSQNTVDLAFPFVCLVTACFVPEEFSSALKGCEYHPETLRALLRCWQASWGEQHSAIYTVERKVCLRGEGIARKRQSPRGQ